MKTRKILNVFLIVAVLASWIYMMFFASELFLNARGIKSLRYFTVLSNLFEALASLVWLINRNEKIKYAAAVSLTLTLMTVLVFLGPLFGYLFMFMGANFFFHLLVPVLAIYEVVFMNKETFDRKDNLLAALPMAVYGIYYIGNILINGIGEWPNSNDWYGFMSWGIPFGFVIYFVILFLTYLFGLIIRKLQQKISGVH